MELKSVHKIFQQSIFRIPSYQRGYTWKNNKSVNSQVSSMKEKLHDINGQLVDLWKDIVNIQTNKWHYTGLLTMIEAEDLVAVETKTIPNIPYYVGLHIARCLNRMCNKYGYTKFK